MKTKTSLTLDEDLINWLKESGNASEKVNGILKDIMNEKKDYYKELHKAEELKKTIQDKINSIVPIIEKTMEEGDKKQREKAAEELKEFQEKEKKEKDQFDILTNILNETMLLDDLLTCKNINDVLDVNRKLIEIGAKNPFSKFGNFGVFLLRDIAGYNKVFISFNPNELKVEEKKDEEDILP